MKRDIPGNSVASALAVERMMVNMANQLVGAERTFDRYFDEDLVIEAIRVRLPQFEGQEYLGIVTARKGDGYLVAFHQAITFSECVRGILARLDNGSLKFREDTKRNDYST